MAKKEFDKYAYYQRAVQSPDFDCGFVARIYRSLRKKPAHILREDFCGTFAVCCEWARRSKDNRAMGIDLDPKPIEYGRKHNLSKLSEEKQKRVELFEGSVLTASLPKADITLALNFSFYLFKSRLLLRKYFSEARKGLKRDGIFMVDCFGGMACGEANTEKTRVGGFYYFWEQEGFNPITAEAKFHIHFKRQGEAKRKKVFSYDWRIWTIPEIRETMLEAGFRKTHVYWEGTSRGGGGDGSFKRTEKGEECDAWVAYIVGEP
jgi:SAM-dependent methyltransferase